MSRLEYKHIIKRTKKRFFFQKKEYKLIFPQKCAYCLSTATKKIVIKESIGLRYSVPYCEEHYKIIKKNQYFFGCLFLLVFFISAGLFVSVMKTPIFGIFDKALKDYATNYIIYAVMLIVSAPLFLIFWTIFRKIFLRKKQREIDLDWSGAVTISEVSKKRFSLLFLNKKYSDEFSQKNDKYIDRIHWYGEVPEYY